MSEPTILPRGVVIVGSLNQKLSVPMSTYTIKLKNVKNFIVANENTGQHPPQSKKKIFF